MLLIQSDNINNSYIIKIIVIRKLSSFSTVIFMALFLSACGSHYGAVKIISTPSGATVINLADKTVVGVTPLILSFKNPSDSRKIIPIELQKDDFFKKTTSFWVEMSHRSEKAARKKPTIIEVILKKQGS